MPTPVFITDDFLLENDAAARLYHDYAESQPIVDYHCHLAPKQIAEDVRFENLAQAWLYGDHYKWRLMRANGVAEHFCTGTASDHDKFMEWARTVPAILRSPLYHWTHLELARYFGVTDRLLGPKTAESIWKDCNAKLADPSFSARGILRKMNVKVVCTTDDPIDTLEHHRAITRDASFPAKVLPTFRPDKAMTVDRPQIFNEWVNALGASANVDIGDFRELVFALRNRHNVFHELGCRISDHGLETVYAEDYSEREIEEIFARARAARQLAAAETAKFRSAVLYECALLDHEKGWVQQVHLGAMRNNNARQFELIGPDTGFDSIGDCAFARPLSRFLDRLDRAGCLPKTILYNLNPRDNDVCASMIGNFQDGATAGKMQYGSAWWFCDHLQGIRAQINSLSNLGVLGRFVGMLTDSRSFLSYPRHEYFRRILCNMLGADMETGLMPKDYELAGGLIADICCRNAVSYFGFDCVA